jgi:DNA-binding NtrC family response regulator
MKNVETILIADNDKSHRLMLEVILNSWGYQTLMSATGPCVLRMIHDIPVDLVMMDISGMERSEMGILSRIKGRTPQTPVILMTAYSPADMIRELKQNGAADVLIKPIKVEELETVFWRACADKCRLPAYLDNTV